MLLVVTIIQIRKVPQKRWVISIYHPMDIVLGSSWVKLGGKTSQQIKIAFVFAIYISTQFSKCTFWLSRGTILTLWGQTLIYLPLGHCYTFSDVILKHYIPNVKFLEWNSSDISLPETMQHNFALKLHTHFLE